MDLWLSRTSFFDSVVIIWHMLNLNHHNSTELIGSSLIRGFMRTWSFNKTCNCDLEWRGSEWQPEKTEFLKVLSHIFIKSPKLITLTGSLGLLLWFY